MSKDTTKRIERIVASGIFDVNWYIQRNVLADDANRENEAIAHYLHYGHAAGAAPHPLFDVSWYRRTNPDIGGTGVAELEHYIAIGILRGSSPSALFDPAWYRMKAGGRVRRRDDPFRHFLHRGAVIGISPILCSTAHSTSLKTSASPSPA